MREPFLHKNILQNSFTKNVVEKCNFATMKNFSIKFFYNIDEICIKEYYIWILLQERHNFP